MCWASTAIYQWILTNSWLKVTKLRNHSKWFSNLYTATINHKRISTPWIDSAVYHGQIDLSMSNISPYPIVLVMNYDWSYGWAEEVFTLSLAPTKWAFSFVQWWKQRRTEEVEDPNWSWTISTTVNAWWCYTRLINGEKQTSCYKEVW
jgi:vancomycin resistance protein YoaR